MRNVLTVGGSDSLAGGGIQADLKTFEELNTFGVSAVTSIATIMPSNVSVSILGAELLERQLDSIMGQMQIQIAKLGLIGNLESIWVIQKQFQKFRLPLVVDPVLSFKEGTVQSRTDYIEALKSAIIPLASVITPNLAEAEKLSGLPIMTTSQLPLAARIIQQMGCPNVVIKGGSQLAGSDAIDYLRMGQQEYWFMEPKIAAETTNGAGCTFSAAITALLACGHPLPIAVARAKKFVREAIAQGIPIGIHSGSVYQGAARQGAGCYAEK